MSTTDPKPGEAWLIRVGDVDIPAIRCRDGATFAWSFVDNHGDRNAINGRAIRRLVPEPTDWETLRAAAVIYRNRTPGVPGQKNVTVDRLREVADCLEAAAQAEAAANAAREALIEKAAKVMCEADSRDWARVWVSRLADAGLLVDPEAEATA